MSRPQLECGSCSYNLAFGEPETTADQNNAILRHCLECTCLTQTTEDKIAMILYRTFKNTAIDPDLYYQAAEALVSAGVISLPVSIGQPLWIIHENKKWDRDSFTWSVTSREVYEVKVSMLQQKADKSWKVRISENGFVFDVSLTELNEEHGYYFTKSRAEAALEEINNETL